MLNEVNIKKNGYNINDCNKCNLHITRIKPVFGEGSLNAKIIFIGEAPGRNEDITGKPFVGRAGKIFDELLNSIGLKRNNVYITNILKCRPPNNRNPLKNEIEMCRIYLDKQIEIIRPKIIVTLGNFSTSDILEKFGLNIDKISRIHGEIFFTSSNFGKLKIIPTYHPAAAIYKKNVKNILLNDFRIIKQNI